MASTPVRLPPPSGVLLLDPLSTDQGGLLPSGQNLITRFGGFTSRPGVTQLGQTLTASEPILGHFWTRDQSEKIRLVIGTTKRWWVFDNASHAWTDLSTAGPGPVLTGVATHPMTFTYWEEGNNQYILGVNDKDGAIEWQIGAAGYAAVSTGYIASSVCTVANRVFYGNVTIGGTRFPTMVAWSSVGTRGTNPALARQKLLDTGDSIVCVRRMGRLSAVIYREMSQWVATAQAGSDAQAFQFTVQDTQPGPLGPAAITTGPGLRHTYLGIDLNLYTFDGVQATLLAPTANLLRGRLNSNAARGLVLVQYSPADQETWIALPLDSETVPTHVLTYSHQTGGIFPVRWASSKATSMLGTWQLELETPTNLLPDIPTDTLPDVPTNQLGLDQGQQVLIVGTNSAVFTLDGLTDVSESIPLTANLLLPVTPGGEYEFDGVELMMEPPGCPISVSVRVGVDYDHLTSVALGTIDPSLTPPTYPAPLEDVAGGPNLTTLRSPEVLRGKVVIIDLTGETGQRVNIRRIELQLYPRLTAN